MNTIRLSTQVAGDGATSGQVPTWDGSKWVPQTPASVSTPTFHGVKLYKSTTQATSNAGATLTWNTEVWDTDAFHDLTTNTDRITWPVAVGAGKISVKAAVLFSSVGQSADNNNALQVNKNGTRVAYASLPFRVGNPTIVMLSAEITIATSDFLQIVATTDASTSTSSGEDVCWWSVKFLG